MALIQINTTPSRRQLVVFSLTWLLFLGVVGLTLWHRTGSLTAATVLWAGAVLVPAVGLIVPAFLRAVYVGVSYATFPFGCVLAIVILAAVYYAVLTPIGLVLRLFRQDPMARRFDRTAKSYWVAHRQRDDLQTYLEQF